jgi:hypothetical protein
MGGFLGDWAAVKSPDHGRIYVAQVGMLELIRGLYAVLIRVLCCVYTWHRFVC